MTTVKTNPTYYVVVKQADPVFGSQSTSVMAMSETSEEEVVAYMQKNGYSEFEVLKSVGRYREKRTVEFEKY